jgi:hypothetical protein
MDAVKRFFSSPRFAVAGASNDSHKFGYKSTSPESGLRSIILTCVDSHSSCLVSSAFFAGDPSESPGPEYRPITFTFLQDRRVTIGPAIPRADVLIGGDSSCSHPPSVAGGPFCGYPRRLAAARDI